MILDGLSLKYNDENVRVACCVTHSEGVHLSAWEVLSQQELRSYGSFKVESGRAEYLLGRYSAKQAYIKLTGKDIGYSKVDIKNGIFGQPYFSDDADFEVSISHSEGMGGAIVFDKAFPMGVDLEIIDKERVKTIQTFVLDDELVHLDGDHEIIVTAIWCMKEALTKAIRTGLTIPLDLLKINKVKQNGKFFECCFENFSQYKGIAKMTGTYAVSVAYPKQLIAGDVV